LIVTYKETLVTIRASVFWINTRCQVPCRATV
jgi:hypothetical protein